MNMPSSTPPVTARLSDDARVKLDHFAKLTNRSRSYIINEAVEHYLQDRMAYLTDLNEAIASIHTEPTYSADEVFNWMQTWGTDSEKSASDVFALPKST